MNLTRAQNHHHGTSLTWLTDRTELNWTELTDSADWRYGKPCKHHKCKAVILLNVMGSNVCLCVRLFAFKHKKNTIIIIRINKFNVCLHVARWHYYDNPKREMDLKWKAHRRRANIKDIFNKYLCFQLYKCFWLLLNKSNH